MNNLHYSLIGFDYKSNGDYTETHICHGQDTEESALEAFDRLMKDLGEPEFTDRRVIREMASVEFYHKATMSDFDSGFRVRKLEETI